MPISKNELHYTAGDDPVIVQLSGLVVLAPNRNNSVFIPQDAVDKIQCVIAGM